LHPHAVLTCSALKRSYRDQLRSHVPGLCFAFLQLDEAAAHERVAARFGEHLFPPTLVANQFATLETPDGEANVLWLDATLPQGALKNQVLAWITSLDPVTETPA
jgi:gluconokinase